MKQTTILYSFLLFILSCSENKTANKTEAEIKEGIVIAADSIRIIEDALNEQYFIVKIKTNDHSDTGSYDIDAAWGYNNASGHFTMPLWDLQPVLKRDTGYSYIIGFYFKNDTAFHDYYLVKGEKGMIQMKYLKAYTFE
jgi:hypothetical protein